LGFERVEFKNDMLNTRAKKALKKLAGRKNAYFADT
jgi:hypothetical protein